MLGALRGPLTFPKAQKGARAMIKGVAFDFDCTLYDRQRVWDRLAEGFAARFETYIDPGLSRAQVHEILCRGDAEGIAHDDTWQGIFARYIQKGLFAQELPFADFYDFIKAEFPPAIVLHEDAVDCLRGLREKGFRLGIYTNGVSDYGRMKLRATGVDALVDYILCSGDIGIEKPDPRGFAVLAGGMGLKPEELAFVGDHPKNDVMGAANAGMTAIWLWALVPWPEGFDAPEHAVKMLSEVPAIVEK